MTNICAAIGVAQLEQADSFIAAKRRLAAWYMEDLKGLPLTFQAESQDTVHTYWMFSVLMRDAETLSRVRKKLKDFGVETRPLFTPAHLMPAFRKNETFAIAESIFTRGLNLPSYPTLTRGQVSYVSALIRDVIQNG
jgi:perosamine synthetase